ncbi:MAG: hypothetical protein K2K25_00210 [Muribaculaceae bacterium]|nr:hypothetical protein [Muribaculaceae bacterium]
MNFRDLFRKNPPSNNIYDTLSHKQKLAAMNLMVVFGGSCSGSEHELNKINHIMSTEGQLMGISGDGMRSGRSQFNGMEGMVNALIGANREALKKLFWAFYCIIAVGKSEQAAHVLLGVYDKWGISEQECINILEARTGKKLSEL